MKHGSTRVVLLEEMGKLAKGQEITLSSAIAAKLIKDGRAEKAGAETEKKTEEKPKTKTKRK